MRLLSYNIRFGGSGREEPLSTIINSCTPDVVILQEAYLPDVVQRVATACKMAEWGSLRGYSVAYLSRTPSQSHRWHHPRFAKRAFLELAVGGIRIFGVHLAAIHSNLMELRRSYEVTAMLRTVSDQKPGTHVIVGDFNTLAPGERLDLNSLPLRLRALAWISGGSLRWKTIQLMLDGGYTDAFHKVHPEDPGFTFPTTTPHVRLDYLFVPTLQIQTVTRCEPVRHPLSPKASDHHPLLSEIVVAG